MNLVNNEELRKSEANSLCNHKKTTCKMTCVEEHFFFSFCRNSCGVFEAEVQSLYLWFKVIKERGVEWESVRVQGADGEVDQRTPAESSTETTCWLLIVFLLFCLSVVLFFLFSFSSVYLFHLFFCLFACSFSPPLTYLIVPLFFQ